MTVAPYRELSRPAQPLVRLQGVQKRYPLMHTGGRRLSAMWSLLRGHGVHDYFEALSSVDLEVYRGQSLGLVGVNGAGKSTLLKIIAGVVKPTAGQVEVHGRIGALLELGAGFHPEYSGRQNVFLACALMGLSRQQTLQRMDDILSFADIGAHVEQPIKHYSSGMVVRLGFAVATVMRPELLITDEVLAVGDESFQKKCSRWMEDYLEGGGTLLLCSHSMYHIQKLCTHAAWIHEGKVRAYGASDRVAQDYLAWHEERSAASRKAPAPGVAAPTVHDSSLYHITSLCLNGRAETLEIGLDAALTVSGTVFSPDGRCPIVASSIVKADGLAVFGTFSDTTAGALWRTGEQEYRYELHYPQVSLLPGTYGVRAHAMDPEGLRLMDHVELPLEVRGQTRHMGAVALRHRWGPRDDTGRMDHAEGA